MKKLALSLTALAAFTGSAVAADLPARTYTKAPMIAPAPSWTGFYLFGGGGYGIWDADSHSYFVPTGAATTVSQRTGGDGYFGTVGGGYDWQFNSNWVGGIFGDAQFGSIRGTVQDTILGVAGREKDQTNWAAGVRLGYLIAPTVLSYVNGGYSGGQFSGATLTPFVGAGPGALTTTTGSFSRNGWFVGGGVENNLNIFGITAPGWFMKTEYRASYFNRATLAETTVATGVLNGQSVTFKPFVETVMTSLVYRFNWSGPVVAKY
jgi:outer membrane immunogenic protein